MGKQQPWKPWHKVVEIRDDLKSGELSLAVFAADLYDVMMKRAKKVYQDPAEFFALTYPTVNLRLLAKDVAHRLSGKNDKAIRQLELTYGGGKTHTLITLFHLMHDPAALPKLAAVEEFKSEIGGLPPKARVAILAFDKLDVEKGMEVLGPKGGKRWLKHPWSVLAYQIAEDEGLKLLHAEGKAEERESAPAENLLTDLLRMPAKEGLATLILLDEVLMYAREKIGLDSGWQSRLENFFQYLTQAATKVDGCAIVASLLATDPKKSDELGKKIISGLYDIFRREREEGVQPVGKDDVAEVLRRRFFKPDSIRDREAFRQHVVAAIKGIEDLDDQFKKERQKNEEEFLKSYPFHPALTDIFYSKWTNLEGFQRTRGILRTFALALRDAETWDQSPLIGANAFLTKGDKDEISEAARELTTVAETEEYEGKRQAWTTILQGELGKARKIESERTGIRYREVEQAVFATFLHSQPIGQKALTRELMILLGPTRPDKIELEKALREWTEVSWFLDEGAISEKDKDSAGRESLPKAWRLGSKPNLRQMHSDACTRVPPDLIESKLLDEIAKNKKLTEGASPAGAKVHTLPHKPNDIEDDGEFHYAILGPRAASESGKPSPEAKRFLDETTGADRQRVNRNAVVLATPSRDGLDIARERIRDYLGWEEVRALLAKSEGELDPIREATLGANVEESRRKIPEAIRQAYCIVVTVSDKNEVHAFKVTVKDEPLFVTIKQDARSRIQDTAISADALLPEGPYNLWRDGETARRVKDLTGAFAQFPHLPKMLRRKEIIETMVLGAKQGIFVLRATRPDRTVRTMWRQEPAEADLKDPSLEVVLSEAAELGELTSDLLLTGNLPGLWEDKSKLIVREIMGYFAGGKVVKIRKENYDEPMTIPKAARPVVEAAIKAAVEQGNLWLVAGTASILAEPIPAGVLSDSAEIMPPPAPIPATDVLPESLTEAWGGTETTVLGISVALSKKAGVNLPWITVRDAVDGAIRARYLEKTADSGPWPCDLAGAAAIRVRSAGGKRDELPTPLPPKPGVRIAEAELKLSEIQDLADAMIEIMKIKGEAELHVVVRVEFKDESEKAKETLAKVNEELKKAGVKIHFS